MSYIIIGVLFNVILNNSMMTQNINLIWCLRLIKTLDKPKKSCVIIMNIS